MLKVMAVLDCGLSFVRPLWSQPHLVLIFSMSDLLAVVEAHLGSIGSWPSDVLIDMFLKEPKSHVIKRVAAFVYGNNVRVSDAVACYKSCNGMYQSYVETSLKAWYFAWDRDDYQSHKEHYYSMEMKFKACINVKALEQCEVLKPVVPVSQFGQAGTHCPLLIGRKIDFVHRGGDPLR